MDNINNSPDNKIMDIVKVASKNRMTIPPNVRKRMKLKRGDSVVFLNCDTHIGIIKMKEEHLFEKIKEQ